MRDAFAIRSLSLAISPREDTVAARWTAAARVIFHPGQRRSSVRPCVFGVRGARLLFLLPLAGRGGQGAAARVVNLSISRNDFVNPEILHPSPPPPPPLPLPLPLRPPRHFTTAPSSLTTIRSAAATKVESTDGRTTALLRSEAGAASLLGSITRE